MFLLGKGTYKYLPASVSKVNAKLVTLPITLLSVIVYFSVGLFSYKLSLHVDV